MQESILTLVEFGKPRRELRPALKDLPRYIASVETSKHRFFLFLDGSILPDNKLIGIGSDHAFYLGVLSSRIHANVGRSERAAGSALETTHVNCKIVPSRRVPFPRSAATVSRPASARRRRIGCASQGAASGASGLTMTQMYNVLEKLKASELLSAQRPAHQESGPCSHPEGMHQRLDKSCSKPMAGP